MDHFCTCSQSTIGLGRPSTEVAFALLTQLCQVCFSAFTKMYSTLPRLIDGLESDNEHDHTHVVLHSCTTKSAAGTRSYLSRTLKCISLLPNTALNERKFDLTQ